MPGPGGAQAPRLFGTPGRHFSRFSSVLYQIGPKKFPAAPAIWAILGPPPGGPKIKKKPGCDPFINIIGDNNINNQLGFYFLEHSMQKKQREFESEHING